MGRRGTDSGTTIEIGGVGAVVAVVLVGVALIGAFVVVNRGRDAAGGQVGSGSPTVQAGAGAVTAQTGSGAPTVQAEIPSLGVANAPVTIVEFADYQCPNCRQFATDVLPWMKETWMARGMVRLEYRDFAIRGDASYRAAEAAHCAGEQGRYWKYHDLLFEDPGDGEPFSASHLVELAERAGLEQGAFATCVESGRHRARVQESTQVALDQGYPGTPTFIVNGRQTEGAIPKERWNELFEAYQAQLGG